VGNYSNLFATQPTDGYDYATILTALVAPLSRGSVTISSADAAVLPVINPGWLTSTVDQEVAVAAYKRARAAFAAPVMQSVLIGPEYYPGSAVQTDAQILAQIRKDAMTVWHASCTCAMGVSSNPAAVIDSHARVFGVKSLRVVDASSFPLLPPGHPQSTICE
jgi:choline dehydrogenase